MYMVYVGLAQAIHTYVYTVYVQCFWHGKYLTYGYIKHTYAILTNLRYVCLVFYALVWPSLALCGCGLDYSMRPLSEPLIHVYVYIYFLYVCCMLLFW
jgi:hypothetical protein